MLYSRTILARNASSILSRLSRLPVELNAHPLLFNLSTNTPTPSLTPLVTALSSLYTFSSIGSFSAPTHPSVPIACSVAFFPKGNATPFSSDIPGRPVTQVGRWHAMRKIRDQEMSLGGVNLRCCWRRTWIGRESGIVVLLAMRSLRR